jgi:hypothetical protein
MRALVGPDVSFEYIVLGLIHFNGANFREYMSSLDSRLTTPEEAEIISAAISLSNVLDSVTSNDDDKQLDIKTIYVCFVDDVSPPQINFGLDWFLIESFKISREFPILGSFLF